MNHNSHYLKLLKIPVWQNRQQEAIEVDEGPLINHEAPFVDVTPKIELIQSNSEETFVMNAAPILPIEIAGSVENCTACQLHHGRTQVINGRGKSKAKLFIITEAPTFTEDLAGKSFADDAGILFDNILKVIGYDSTDVYITPYVKCSPYQAFITKEEETRCAQHLMKELDQIKPQKILLLGRNVAKFLLNSNQPFDDLRRSQGSLNIFNRNIPVYISYNLYQLLKFPEEKSKLWKDIKCLVE